MTPHAWSSDATSVPNAAQLSTAEAPLLKVLNQFSSASKLPYLKILLDHGLTGPVLQEHVENYAHLTPWLEAINHHVILENNPENLQRWGQLTSALMHRLDALPTLPMTQILQWLTVLNTPDYEALGLFSLSKSPPPLSPDSAHRLVELGVLKTDGSALTPQAQTFLELLQTGTL